MILHRAAIAPIPKFAAVAEHAIDAIEQALVERDDDLQAFLDQEHRNFDHRQPHLCAWIAGHLSDVRDELAQSLGYFLTVSVYMAFAEAFPSRLTEVDDHAIELAERTLLTDEELRAHDPNRVMGSDDVVAMDQPALLQFVQFHVDEALSQSNHDIDLNQLDHIYRTTLIEVIALSHAVASPTGSMHPPPQSVQ